ncbi:alkaline phosphatase family protein [Bradyrhizobium sp. CCGUVB4N]|uniref:beta strand repeat-containing protein n=1 Tax=Bradyrhizobium sp. CCGUVB4N TaxID=2949631 RepID=UPI0020B3511C|nr:alkaline phosphatase family protein [Bradyrhizobium sp. CCGUVB4N]MCP3381000.1 alkaline phosphatase family protein [Bradyrhizobium sp. CCGUVB4N]
MTYSSQIQTSFSGPLDTSTYPPDSGLAVGLNYVVMIDGGQIEWTNLAGGSPTQQSVYSFFSPLSPTGGLYGQRVAYDSVNQRFVAIMEYLAPDGVTTSIDIAVSKDSNPNDGWTFSQLNTTITISGQPTDSDRPILAVDGSNVYISTAQYNTSASGYAGTENWVIGDTAGAGGGIYGGGTLSVTASEAMPSTQGKFAVASGNNGKTYYASDFSSGGQIVVAVQIYDKATNTFSTTSTVNLGNIDQGGSYTAQQQGTSLPLDAGDNRIASMVYANGFLYAVAEMKPTGSSVPLVHWFKIDVSNPSAPSLVAQGDISGAAIGTSVATFNPSIAVDTAGDVLINFTASGPNMYPADYYVFQGGSDPVGSFSAPILYQASTGFFNAGDGASVQSWGVNSSATVDPNSPNAFWVSNEYVASGWWQTSVAKIAIQNSTPTGPVVSSIVASGTGITSGAGDLNAGKVVTLTVNFSAAVTVNTSGGTPTITLNDGGTASYTGGTGSTALTFSYTVAAGQNTADLIVSALNLNGATIADGSGNAANLTGATNYNPTGILQIDTTAPTIASIVPTGTGITNGTGNVSTGGIITLTVNLSEAVTVNTSGGTPTLTLNDGGTASYTGGTGSTALTFSYTVAAGQTTSDLAISAFNLNGATINDGAGNAANLAGAANYNPTGTLQVNVTAPTVASIAASGTGITSGAGDLNAGQVVTLTVTFSAAVTVNTSGGTPSLTLNDGGTASYTGGTGSTALTFSYTVAAGQNTADLIISALNLNGATIVDGSGNAANLTGATNYNPAGILQIDTTAPTIASIVATGTGITNGTGTVSTGGVVTLTVNLSEAVTVNTSGGTPTLTLNDGGTASYTGGTGSTALTFSYTVAAGQTTSDLAISALNLNGAVVNDLAGNAANLAGATNYNPTGTLQVNPTTAAKPNHIVVLSLENENYSDIVGSSQAPYLNSLIAQGMLLTNYNGVTHPSQPNYIALFSGSTQGITTNGNFPQLPASVPTLASTLAASGYTFGGYAETTADPERQPWIHFANSASTAHDFSAFPQTAAGFANLPTVSYVSPNDADNMTPTSDNGGGIPAGDAWVQANLSAYAAWAQANNSLLIVTFDENNTNPAVTYPSHVAAIVVGGGVPAGAVNDSPTDPYSLLATIESLYGAAPIGASAGVPALNLYSATPARASTSVTRSFSGLSDRTNTPPQNALAVGPNYIFTAETTHYAITDLSGNPIVSNGSLYSLFAPLGGTLDNALLDARAVYDGSTGRYVVTADNFQPGGGNFATNVDIAVSVDSNPSDGWYLASIDTSNGKTTQSDMPYLSVSNGKIYVSTPEFLDAGGGYNNGEFIVNESSVIAAGNRAITPDASTSVPSTASIMRNVAGDNGVTYYLSAHSDARETTLTYQTYDPTHGFSATQTIFLGDADVGGGGSNFTTAQLGTTKKLDINDGRIQSLAYTSSGGHNYVYGVSEAMPSAGSPAQIEWFKLDVTDPTNPQYVIGNVISGASIGTGVAVFNPSIAVDQNGDVLINFSASGSNMYPSDYYMVLGAGASAFTAPTLYQASTTFFDSGTLNDQRWGTYSTAIADPNNPNGFWISNEYVANGWWQTVVTQIAVQGSGATAPTVSSIAASGTGITSGVGDLNAGKVVTLTVNFSAAVTVNTSGGTPSLALNDGGSASYTGGSGSTALTFSYTVAAGQNTADLIVSSLNLNGATISGGGNAANLTGATNYNPTGILQIDTTAPTIASIVPTGTGITNGTGSVSTGVVVTLTVNLSEAVTVNTTGGTPTLTLNDGGTASYVSGSGSTALAFSYTVAAGQTTSDLVISSFNLNGAVINDGAGNATNLAGATNYNPAGTLQVNPTATTVASIAASGTGITSGAGDLNAGKVVTLTVTFSAAVTVNTSGGTPSLTLNDGGTASYTGGSGGTALTFSYTVAAGQNTADLIVSALNLNGGTITGGNGIAANLTGATNYNPTGILQIDTTAPTIASIVPTGTGITNGTGTVSTGAVVTLTVNLSEAVTVNTTGGTPTLTLNDGGTATYTGGTGSTALTFSYTVAAGQTTADLAISSLNLNGAVISDGASNAANLAGATNYNPAGTLQVNPTATTVASIAASGTGITSGVGDLNAGKVVTLTVTFSAAVTVNTSGGTPSLALNDGGSASYTGGSGSTALTFSYTVAAGQNTADLIISALNLNGATIADGSGNAANLTGATNYNPAGILQIDTTAPTIASIVPTGTGITNGTGTVSTGGVVTLTVNLSEAVTVNTTGGSPTLTLNDGGTASYTGGTGSTALTFSYTVAAGQTTADLAISSLNLNGAVVNDLAGNAANLAGATNYNPAGTLQVNPTATTVASIAASGTGITSGAGDLNAGKVVTLTVTFSAAVTVNTSGGTPSLTLNDGGTASYTGGSGSTALTFSYTVAAGQNTADLIVSALNLNGGTITGGNGVAANLTGATNYNPAGILQIDTTAPTIASVAASGTGITSGSGNLNAGKVVTLTVNFSEAVTVNTTGGTPTLTLNDGGTASYTGGTGSTALIFSYTVAAGQNTADLIVSALNLNGATISDGGGNAANLAGATNANPAGTLKIDTTAPTIASIVPTGTGITSGTGNISTGAVVTLTVNLSEAVTVNTTGGTPTLTLNDGGTASYVSGSGGTALTFSYTVAAGQTTSDLVISALNLNGATINDGAGNAANLAGATNYNPAGTLQVNTTATTVASIVASGTGVTSGAGDLNAGKVVTLTVNFSAAVTVNTTGGTPRLTLNDGGTASYTGGSGGTALTFSYTVAAGQNTADLIVSALNLNGGTITGGNGIAANLTGATNYNPAGTLQIDTTAPTIASIVASGTGITNGAGSVSTGQVVTLTVNLSEAVTVNTSGGTPSLTLNDGGTASYTGGTGSTALTFSYTVAAGQTTSDLAISSLNLNGAVISDGAGNAANLAGATNYNPAGTLQVNPTTTGTGVPKFSHIVVVVEENHNYDQIAGSSQAPYINSLMAGGASLTNMTAEAHPSQPDYFALYAGSTFGTTDDNSYSLPDPTLYTVLKNGGYSFTGYVDEGGIGSDFNHDPWVSFPEGRTVQTDFTSFPSLFANGNYSSLPTVSYVIPSVSNDMHDGTIAQGDTWLQQNLSAYAQWAVNNNSLLVVTWDENDDSTSEAAANTIPTLLYGANVVPGNYNTAYNHYNLLSTITASLGLTGPNNAATAAPIQVFGTAAAGAAALAVDQDGAPESPALSISSNSLTVNAGGSVALGITATPVDSDDQLSVSISGLPSYESITAPAGNTVTSSLQSDGTTTWTIAEGSSTTGQPLTGLTLSSSYTGTDHPVATLTVTASNTTSGEAATSASQTMTVTDPPAPAPSGPGAAPPWDAGNIDRLAALMNQFAAAGFDGHGPGPFCPPSNPNVGWDNQAALAAAHLHTG